MSYTPIVSATDLTTHLYQEQLDEITRDDGGVLATKAINLAIDETKVYMSRFDLTAMFGSATLNVSASSTDEFLNNLIKDLAVWQLIRLGNPSINYDHSRWCYEAAIETLDKIQAGKMTPQNWALHDTTQDVIPPGDAVQSSYNPPRNNYFWPQESGE